MENYIIHGFDITRTDNHVVIHIRREGNALIFAIQDNGKGMEPERLAEQREKIGNGEGMGVDSIGLVNISQRIRLIYGADYGVAIESGSMGTGVTVRVKACSVEELRTRVQSDAC